MAGSCIVMDCIAGQTLREFLKTHPDKATRLRIVKEMLTAMSYYHSLQVIHRDLKPVSSFMLGRGIIANPFLAEETCGTDTGDRRQRIYAFVRELYNARLQQAGGSPKVIGRMKELWSYLMHSFLEPQQVWRKIKKLNELWEYEDAVTRIFEEEELP